MHQGEIILYQPGNQPDFHIEVQIEDDEVWLTQAQMVELFSATKQNVSLHINDIYKEVWFVIEATVAKNETVQKEG